MAGCVCKAARLAWQAAAKNCNKLLVANQEPPSDTRSWKAPAIVAGPAMSNVVGAICAPRMRHTSVLCIPASTLVSQSGPATSMHSCNAARYA